MGRTAVHVGRCFGDRVAKVAKAAGRVCEVCAKGRGASMRRTVYVVMLMRWVGRKETGEKTEGYGDSWL